MPTTDPDGPTVDLEISCEAEGLPDQSTVSRWIARAAAASTGLPAHAEVSVRIVDEDEMRELNRRYRGRDGATNVLAFPADLRRLPGLPDSAAVLLGDVVICAAVVAREAGEQGKSIGDHWAHLLVHGFLHLAGYDHESAADAEVMEALEIRILADQGLGNPYENRGPN